MDNTPSQDEFDKTLELLFNTTKKELAYFFNENPIFAVKFSEWVLEASRKNKIITQNKNGNDKEMARRRRARVYWIDFGVNIGSEFNHPHFCVVINESYYTALVVPLSSIKEETSEWKKNEDLIIEIGCIEDLPVDKKPCYALINQMRAVSKQRLSNFKLKGQYYDLRLTNDQMDLIDKKISSLCKSK